jgi:hypothetical protein
MKYNIMLTIAVLLMAAYHALLQCFGREECHNALADSPHPTGAIPLIAEFAPSLTHLMVKAGATAGNFALCAATNRPLGTCTDTPASGERGNVRHLGAATGTCVARGSKAIAVQVPIYTTAAGKVTDTSVTGCYLVGMSVTACTGDGAEFEFVPCFPVVQP